MRVFGVATAVCISAVCSAGCGKDVVRLPCTGGRAPFLLSPISVGINVGEEVTFIRVARDDVPSGVGCELFPDSPELSWSLVDEGVVIIVASDDSAATVRGVNTGGTGIHAQLTRSPEAVATAEISVR